MHPFNRFQKNLLQAIVTMSIGLILLSMYQVAVTGNSFWWPVMFVAVAIVLKAISTLPAGHPLKFIYRWC